MGGGREKVVASLFTSLTSFGSWLFFAFFRFYHRAWCFFCDFILTFKCWIIMTARLLMAVCFLAALSFNRDCSCAAIITKKTEANMLGVPDFGGTPSNALRQLQMDQIRRMRETYLDQMQTK